MHKWHCRPRRALTGPPGEGIRLRGTRPGWSECGSWTGGRRTARAELGTRRASTLGDTIRDCSRRHEMDSQPSHLSRSHPGTARAGPGQSRAGVGTAAGRGGCRGFVGPVPQPLSIRAIQPVRTIPQRRNRPQEVLSMNLNPSMRDSGTQGFRDSGIERAAAVGPDVPTPLAAASPATSSVQNRPVRKTCGPGTLNPDSVNPSILHSFNSSLEGSTLNTLRP